MAAHDRWRAVAVADAQSGDPEMHSDLARSKLQLELGLEMGMEIEMEMDMEV